MDRFEADAIEREVYWSGWGYCSKGQIGNMKHDNYTLQPNLIEIGNTILCDSSAGENHAIFTDSKSVYACGSNIFGQLGIGEEDKPLKNFHNIKVLDGNNFWSLSWGAEHSFAVSTKGEVFSWGLNFKGQLGSGTFDNRYIPELVENLFSQDEKTMGSTKSSMFFMKRSKSREQVNGKPSSSNRHAKSTTPADRGVSDYKDSKPSHSVDLTSKNQREDSTGNPSSDSILITGEKVVQIWCGAIHTLALTNWGRVLSCGNGSSYALGHGSRETLTCFKAIDSFTENNIKMVIIAAGMNHSGCISEKGRVYMWGITSDISFSEEMKEKWLLKIPSLINFAGGRSKEPVITDLKLGECFSMALSSSGKVYTWGTNELGQLGNGDDQPTAEPGVVTALSESISKIGCGLKHWIVISTTYQVYSWGWNVKGQLGVKTDNIWSPIPLHVTSFDHVNPFKIICGYYHNICFSYRPPKSPSLEDEFSLLGNNKNLNKDEEMIKLKQEVVRLRKQLLLQSGQILLNSNLHDSEADSSAYDEMIEKQLGHKKKTFSATMMETERQFHANFEIKYKDLKFDKRISEGGYGVVHKGRWMSTVVAIKEIKKEIIEQDKLEEFRNEWAVMEVIRHPNIVMFLGACTKPPHLCIVLEYCGRGSLWSCLHDMSNKLSWEFRK
jgi:alpha-tubulin suppressor-like RCC1 family protein